MILIAIEENQVKKMKSPEDVENLPEGTFLVDTDVQFIPRIGETFEISKRMLFVKDVRWSIQNNTVIIVVSDNYEPVRKF